MTKFAINLNVLTKDMTKHLPKTDSRFRPDLRAFEHGDIPLASSEKHRLEEKQRKRRREMKENNQNWSPLWFDFQLEGKKVIHYKFNH